MLHEVSRVLHNAGRFVVVVWCVFFGVHNVIAPRIFEESELRDSAAIELCFS